MSLQNTLKALSDPIRREILNLLKNGRLSAGDIASHFDVTAASISRHLSVLKDADLIRDTREGKFIYYDLNTSVLEDIMLWITELKGDTTYEKNHICYVDAGFCSVSHGIVDTGFECCSARGLGDEQSGERLRRR